MAVSSGGVVKTVMCSICGNDKPERIDDFAGLPLKRPMYKCHTCGSLWEPLNWGASAEPPPESGTRLKSTG